MIYGNGWRWQFLEGGREIGIGEFQVLLYVYLAGRFSLDAKDYSYIILDATGHRANLHYSA